MSAEDTSIWAMLAEWAAPIAAWAAVGVVLWTNKKERRERVANRLQTNIFNLRTDYQKLGRSVQTFWRVIGEVYPRFHQDDDESPKRIEELVKSAGLPPNSEPREGIALKDWPKENLKLLTKEQRLLWDFVSFVYPKKNGKQGNVTDHMPMSSEIAEDFHWARRDLAQTWDRWVPLINMEYLCKNFKANDHQVVLLVWLEIALLQWTEDVAPGKIHLYDFAKALTEIW